VAVIVSEWSQSAGFDAIKAAQVIAFFARREGGKIDKLKVIKLVYLADRLSFQRRFQPMNFDAYFSLPHGPVPSSALDGINGKASHDVWKLVSLTGVKVSVSNDVTDDHLSRADRAILEEIWASFGGMTAVQLRNWTHKNCPEYEEVSGGSLPITYFEILEAVGVEDASDVAKELRRLQREMACLPVSDAA
jgi:uncharacterized phage-associated protein